MNGETGKTLLSSWVKKFDSSSVLRKKFFNLWKDEDEILSSSIYGVIKEVKNLDHLYLDIVKKVEKPLASIASELIKYYEQDLIAKGFKINKGSCRTEPLLSTVEDYNKKSELEGVALYFYSLYKRNGWGPEDFEYLHDKTVKQSLKCKNLLQFSETEVRQLIQKISKEESNPKVKEYLHSEMLNLIVEDQHGDIRKLHPGYNHSTLRAINKNKPTDVNMYTVEYINDQIRDGNWIVIQGTSMNSDILIHKGNADERLTIHDDNQSIGTSIVSSRYIQKFKDGKTKQEEKPMKNTQNEISIKVPTSAYAETKTITSYGIEIPVDDEEALTSIIRRIDQDQENLKVLNKNAKSKRIVGQINKLGAARTKIAILLDALPDE